MTDLPFRAKLAALPESPGVYRMMDARGAVLYIGKAKSLRARVRSYFQAGASDERVLLPFLRAKIADFDVFVVENEKEALLLENSLIKQHKPRYNIRLVDDKTYLSLRLDRRHPFPRFTTVRRQRPDGSRYFGPYSSARAVRDTLKVIYRSFGIRSCSDAVFANRARPCLYYQIGQCLAPCVGYVTESDYARALDEAEMLLGGRNRELVARLREEMDAHSRAEEFEQAAKVRDRLRAVERTLEKQDVALSRDLDFDVVGHAAAGQDHVFTWLYVRDGRIADTATLRVKDRLGQPPAELLSGVLVQAYDERAVPAEILMLEEPASRDLLEEVLSDRRTRKCVILRPERGIKHRLAEMAQANAGATIQLGLKRGEGNVRLLAALQELLALPRSPRRIECFDMSNLQGQLAVGSMAVALDGELAPREYRRYRIRSAAGGDDYAMMREVLSRRLGRGLDDGTLPDLLVVDGGRGQLSIARSVAEELGAEDLPLLGIAKGPDRDAGRETLHTLDREEPIALPHHDERLHFLQRLRDEAHRFAITYHRKLRHKRDLQSALTSIPGIGPARSRALLRTLGSLAAVRQASPETLRSIPGMSDRSARTVWEALHGAVAEATASDADSDPDTGAGES